MINLIETIFCETYLEQPNKQCGNANGSHDPSVVIQQGLSAPLHPDIELLCQEIVVVVSAVVGQLVLDAGPWGAGVAAAEGDSIHQELPINVALQTAATGQSVAITNLVSAAGSACDFRKGSNTSLLRCRPLQCNKRKRRVYFQLEKLFTAGKLNIGFAVFKCGIAQCLIWFFILCHEM